MQRFKLSCWRMLCLQRLWPLATTPRLFKKCIIGDRKVESSYLNIVTCTKRRVTRNSVSRQFRCQVAIESNKGFWWGVITSCQITGILEPLPDLLSGKSQRMRVPRWAFLVLHNLLPKNTIAPTRQMPEKESYDSNLMFKGKLNVMVFWCFMKFQAIDSSQS